MTNPVEPNNNTTAIGNKDPDDPGDDIKTIYTAPEQSERVDSIPTLTPFDQQEAENGTVKEALPLEEHGEGDKRETWGNKIEFVLACLGNMVGLGNIWRFPYLAYENGGGAFVFCYVVMIFLVGVPLLLLETSLGQYTAMGPVHVYSSIAPLFKGLGVTAILASALIAVFYNMILAWSLFYFFEAFMGQRWQKCGQPWNSPNCREITSTSPITNMTVPSTAEFFDNYILGKSDSISDMSSPRLGLLLALIISWVVVISALSKGVKSSGKVVYFTAIFPYVLLVILFIRGITLPGAMAGLKYFFFIDLTKIGDATVWRHATVQVFFSVGAGVGTMITYGSYNPFHNSLVRDTVFLVIGDMTTSIFAGAVVFSMIGYVAHVVQKDVNAVIKSGEGLAFIVIPDGLSQMPGSIVWSLAFFFMLFLLGIDSQFGYVENVTSFFFDYLRSKGKIPNKPLIVASLGTFLLILGIPMTTSAGLFFFNILDYFASGVPVIFVGLMECVLVAHVYGLETYFQNLLYMTGFDPGDKTKSHFKVALWTIAPVFLTGVLAVDIFSMMSNSIKGRINGEPNPTWAIVLGWTVALGPIAAIPIGMIHFLVTCKQGDNLWQKVKIGIKPINKFNRNAIKSGEFLKKDKDKDKDPEDVVVPTSTAAV